MVPEYVLSNGYKKNMFKHTHISPLLFFILYSFDPYEYILYSYDSI